MQTVRLILMGALLVGVLVGGFLTKEVLTLESWVRWASLGGAILVGIWMLAVIAVLGMSLFTTGDDLWESWYFKKMRKRYGNGWGGPSTIKDPNTGEPSARRLQISVCRAVVLSSRTLLGFTVVGVVGTAFVAIFVGALIGPTYFGGVIAFSGFDSPYNFLLFEKGGSLMIATLTAQMVAVFLLVTVIFWLPRGFNTLLWKISVPLFSINVIVGFIIVPMKAFGTASVLKWGGIAMGGVADGILAIVLLVLLITGMVKMSKKLSRETVTGVLLLGQLAALKQKVCPFIIQGKKTPQPQP